MPSIFIFSNCQLFYLFLSDTETSVSTATIKTISAGGLGAWIEILAGIENQCGSALQLISEALLLKFFPSTTRKPFLNTLISAGVQGNLVEYGLLSSIAR